MRLRPTPSVRSCLSSLIWGGERLDVVVRQPKLLQSAQLPDLKKQATAMGDDANREGYDKEMGSVAIEAFYDRASP